MAFRLLNPNPVRGFHGGTPDARRLGRPRDDGRFFFPTLNMIALLILALADPLPRLPADDAPRGELEPPDPLPLRDERHRLGLGVSVMMGAYSWQNRWTAAATFAFDLHADF